MYTATDIRWWTLQVAFPQSTEKIGKDRIFRRSILERSIQDDKGIRRIRRTEEKLERIYIYNEYLVGSYAIYLSGFAIAGAGGELWRDLPELGKGPQMPPKCIS